MTLGHNSFPDATQSNLDRESFSYNGYPELKDSQTERLALLGKQNLRMVCHLNEKNPAYGRQSISPPMRIVAPMP